MVQKATLSSRTSMLADTIMRKLRTYLTDKFTVCVTV
jgi:hypothetical protein